LSFCTLRNASQLSAAHDHHRRTLTHVIVAQLCTDLSWYRQQPHITPFPIFVPLPSFGLHDAVCQPANLFGPHWTSLDLLGLLDLSDLRASSGERRCARIKLCRTASPCSIADIGLDAIFPMPPGEPAMLLCTYVRTYRPSSNTYSIHTHHNKPMRVHLFVNIMAHSAGTWSREALMSRLVSAFFYQYMY